MKAPATTIAMLVRASKEATATPRRPRCIVYTNSVQLSRFRSCWLILPLFTALSLCAQQHPKSAADLSGTVEIPVRLVKTLRADKAHSNDPLEFRTLEAVLVNKQVIPADARLYGRVLSVQPKQGDKPSKLAVLVERAEWKQHSLPLHAFAASELTLSITQTQAPSMPGTFPPTSRPPRQNPRAGVSDDPQLTGVIKPPQDASEPSQDSPAHTHPTLKRDVRIVSAEDGTVYFVSAESNVKLPAGLLLMLRNQPVR